MKERPILFSGPMVRAILEGRKTFTRIAFPDDATTFPKDKNGQVQCPCGQPGDRLWVRETWMTSKYCDDKAPSELEIPGGGYGWPVWYKADGTINLRGRKVLSGGPGFVTKGKVRRSNSMPRWASRITLEIVSVSVGESQDITEEEARLEGVQPWAQDDGRYVDGYRLMWESVHGRGSWIRNVMVWVVEFKEVKP